GKAERAASYGRRFIGEAAERATEDVGKPVYLGEYGWRVNLQAGDVASQLQRRAELFEEWHSAALDAGIGGAVAWELLSDSRLQYHREEPGEGETVGFAYPEHDDTCAELRRFAEHIDEQSAA
ncbi:MAG: hypothetical protein ABEI97_04760, partial [Candidatus Nanohaloarchaea archaeon]